jgi:hypothetical protein
MGRHGCNAAGVPVQALCAMASGRAVRSMKEFDLEVPLRWGDMDATPQAFPFRRCAPWHPGGQLRA